MLRPPRIPGCSSQPCPSTAASASMAAASSPAPWCLDAQRRLSGAECSSSGRGGGGPLFSGGGSGGWHSRGHSGSCGDGSLASSELWGSALHRRGHGPMRTGTPKGAPQRAAQCVPTSARQRRSAAGEATGKSSGREDGSHRAAGGADDGRGERRKCVVSPHDPGRRALAPLQSAHVSADTGRTGATTELSHSSRQLRNGARS